MVHEDLLAALQELLEASSALMSGQPPTEIEIVRYMRAHDWAKRLINREGCK